MLKKWVFSSLLFTLLPSMTWADNAIDGQQLTQKNCIRCHGSEVYTRANRRVDSLARLHGQVRMCNTQLETQLFDEDIEAIAKHLNEAYYHFK